MDWGRIFTQTLSESIGPFAIAYMLAAQGLNIHFGYAGLLNFGQAGFMAMGAYGMAIASTPDTLGGYGLPLWVGVAIGMLAAVVLALLLGLPTLRLRGDYLAIVTIAGSEIIRLFVRSEATEDFAGGNSGINGFARGFYEANPFNNGKRYAFGPLEFLGKDLWLLSVGWVVVIVTTMLVTFLVRSPWGRVLKSIRENEDAVRSLGKNVQGFKMQALVLGGVLGAMGGMILAIQKNLATPDDYATRTTFISYAALILGGAARAGGPVVGGIIWYAVFSFSTALVSEMTENDVFPKSVSSDAGVLPFIFLGIILICLVVFRPQGVFGNRREIELDAR